MSRRRRKTPAMLLSTRSEKVVMGLASALAFRSLTGEQRRQWRYEAIELLELLAQVRP